MKPQHLILLAFFLILVSSCSNRTYAPALFHQDIAYQPKPTSFDTVKTANYFSGGINFYTDPTWADMLISGQINYSHAQVFDNFNVSYGAFGVFGDYESGSNNASEPYTFSDKFFGAVGGRASANLYSKLERADFRYLGVEIAYSHEFGSYADFRHLVSTLPGFNVDTRTDLVTVGLTSELIFHNIHNTNIQHGIRFFLGETLGDNSFSRDHLDHRYIEPEFLDTIFPKVSYYVKFGKYFATIEGGKQIFLRFGASF